MKYFANTLGFVMFFVPLIFITIILYLIDKTYFPNFARMEYGGVMVVPIYLSGLLVVFSSLTYNTTILKPGSIAIFVVCLIITVLAEI